MELPMQAMPGQCPESAGSPTFLGGLGPRWLEMERVMGIEYIAGAPLLSANQTVASAVVCCV
jgi:hypothetical protein